MKKNILFLSVFLLLFLTGCSTKRTYFQPVDEVVAGSMKYEGSVSDDIKYITLNCATLKNGEIITKNSLDKTVKLEKNEMLLDKVNGKYLVSNLSGLFKIIDENNHISYQRKFPTQIVAAAFDNNDLALITSDNIYYLIRISSDTIMMSEKAADIYAVNFKIASPKFVGPIIVYPTLDGKLVIVDRISGKIRKDFYVSSQPFFNNIMNLNIIGNNMYAVTSTKIMMITPQDTKGYNAEIKDVLFHKDKIYAFLKDGNVDMLDLNLNKINSKKFTFAIFSDAFVVQDRIHIIEKTGYLIKTDLDLNNERVYKLDGEIKKKIFSGSGIFYHGDNYIKF